jgi:RimJ/RimL family protein N-acetyltransferase
VQLGDVRPAPSTPRRTIELRPWTKTDASALQAVLASSDDLRSQFGRGDLTTVEGCADIIARYLEVRVPSMRNFAVSLSGRAVGNVGVSHMEHRHDTGWVSYWLAAEVRGRGLATRAVASAAAWAFAEQDLFRLELGHRVSNPASCRVAVRAGFPVEGVERLKLKQDDQRFDVETHARLRSDPAPQVQLLAIR